MQIEEFNTVSAAEAAEVLRRCAAVDSFVTAVVAGRPYADLDSLLATAAAQTDMWSDAEVETALALQPPSGTKVAGHGRSARLSRKERAALEDEEADVLARLDEGVATYEARFGRPYLVRAAGRAPEQLLAILKQRLGHDDMTERRVTREQLGEIALLRLQQLFGVTP